jgi:hypothetical protein
VPRILWDEQGTRGFHTGIDRGVLYVSTFPGVAWNGLVRVSEDPTGGDAAEYYLDAEKYQNVPALEEYAATIEAFSSPAEFAPCAGWAHLSPGLFTTNQPAKPFGFSYRTLRGDDILGTAGGYQVHVVYNALAQVSDFTHRTIQDSAGVDPYSWKISTVPVNVTGFKPASHFVIDSLNTDSLLMAAVEDILYGTASTDPALPLAQELVMMLGES